MWFSATSLDCVMVITYFILFIGLGLVQARYNFMAAVVEYATPFTPNLNPDDVLVYNALKYQEFMTNASQYKVDIIVFPESGLTGDNEKSFITVPSPMEKLAPCDFTSDFHLVLIIISCASRSLGMYTVINLSEKQSNYKYNTNVAFDRQGTIIGRYRKYNIYGENVNRTDKAEHSYFDTDFGVRFGMFTCFDIEFKDPALVLAKYFSINHFVFPNCWQSELPFLTAIQMQGGWAYSLDVVLLASGCNNPSSGSTGSGIYLGKSGPLTTYQSNEHLSTMLIAQVPILHNYTGNPNTTVLVSKEFSLSDRNSSLNILRDYLEVYRTDYLLETVDHNNISGGKDSLNKTFTIDTTLCDKDFCCHFEVQVTLLLSDSPPPNITRGDEYTSSVYRLAVFNGVRSYGGGIATGGVQVCGIISCLNMSLSSCGLRSDIEHSLPIPLVSEDGQDFYKISTTFNFIYISAEFFYNNTFVFPDLLVTGEGSLFGSLYTNGHVIFEQFEPYNQTALYRFRVDNDIEHLVSAALYGRQFDQDGQPRTDVSSSNEIKIVLSNIFTVAFVVLYFNC